MKLSQSFFNEYESYITPSLFKQMEYCKRYIYYKEVLKINQNLYNRYKVKKGSEIHKFKENTNKTYLRSEFQVVDKMIEYKLYSKEYNIKGQVDEILITKNKEYIPLDYKFSKMGEGAYKSTITQLTIYAIMIDEMFNTNVKKGLISYTRDNYILEEILITEESKKKLTENIKEYELILSGYFPTGAKNIKQCIDCYYNKICIGI